MGYLERLEAYRDDMFEMLAESVARPSVGSEAVKTEDGSILPYGAGVHEALLHMLAAGKKMGFDTCNDDNYAGHIEWRSPQGGDEYFGIIGHLDVVPVDSGWSTDPFEMIDKGDGKVYGRGVADDKGPVVASLFALKALKDEGIEPKMNIRIVLGLNEETGSESAEHYTESFGHPVMGFTPDADFPIVNGEMGIMVFDVAQKFTSKAGKDDLRLTKLEGGTAHNAVPAAAKAVLAGDASRFSLIKDMMKAYVSETGYTLTSKNQGKSLVIEAKGKAAHGAHPDLGLNAVSILMDFLGRISFANEELNEFIEFYNEHIGFCLHGEKMGCYFEDEPSGPLIFNVGVANINEELASVSVNIRYPVSITSDEVIGAIEQVMGDGRIGIVVRMDQAPIYKGTDDPMVVKMLEAYRSETGDDKTGPITAAGGTYAKMFRNVLAFGGQFPGEKNTMHQADEELSKESLMKMARIYAKAVYSLCCE